MFYEWKNTILQMHLYIYVHLPLVLYIECMKGSNLNEDTFMHVHAFVYTQLNFTYNAHTHTHTQQQQGQMGYPTLLPSACLPQSVTNPPTTLPPQYDTNFNPSYSPSLPNTFQSFAANNFNGLLPQQLNQSLIAVDMPVNHTSIPHSKHTGLNIGGLDQHRFMVGGPLSGAFPGHEVARAIGVPLVVTGRNDTGIVENSPVYKKSRKRRYSETGTDMQGRNTQSI